MGHDDGTPIIECRKDIVRPGDYSLAQVRVGRHVLDMDDNEVVAVGTEEIVVVVVVDSEVIPVVGAAETAGAKPILTEIGVVRGGCRRLIGIVHI